ncbi:unannotated protein [freshwater metagenome]|uniref:Unannotated protein n=1 Tax=freshwater metagenome TaxID=449393 RepID=A0A6J7D4F6_9ZZZZ
MDSLGIKTRSHLDEVDSFGDPTIPVGEAFHLETRDADNSLSLRRCEGLSDERVHHVVIDVRHATEDSECVVFTQNAGLPRDVDDIELARGHRVNPDRVDIHAEGNDGPGGTHGVECGHSRWIRPQRPAEAMTDNRLDAVGGVLPQNLDDRVGVVGGQKVRPRAHLRPRTDVNVFVPQSRKNLVTLGIKVS